MSFVDRFLAHYAVHRDFSKASKFEVLIHLNESLLQRLGSGYDLRFQCEAAELPGYNFDTVDGLTYGASYAIAARPVYGDLKLMFICAGDLWEKRFFDQWQEFILPKRDYLARYRDEYVGNIDVVQYYETVDPVYGALVKESLPDSRANYNYGPEMSYRARYHEAFPASVEPIPLSWGDDSVNRVSVTFKYKHWEIIDRRVGS
jgi:hypothetical protein